MDYDFTSSMESSLDAISRGELNYIDFLKSCKEILNSSISQAKATIEKDKDSQPDTSEGKLCPKCNSLLGKKKGIYGDYYKCTQCNYKGNPDKPKAELELVGKDCPECKSPLVYRASKKGTRFIGCSNYPKCKHSEFIDDDGNPNNQRVILDEPCPECGKPLVKITFKGRSFIGCLGFNKKDKNSCKYIRKI